MRTPSAWQFMIRKSDPSATAQNSRHTSTTEIIPGGAAVGIAFPRDGCGNKEYWSEDFRPHFAQPAWLVDAGNFRHGSALPLIRSRREAACISSLIFVFRAFASSVLSIWQSFFVATDPLKRSMHKAGLFQRFSTRDLNLSRTPQMFSSHGC